MAEKRIDNLGNQTPLLNRRPNCYLRWRKTSLRWRKTSKKQPIRRLRS